MTIDELLIKHGSDKSTWHRYGPVYDELFPDRDAVTAVMEIGVEGGNSVRAWKEAFPNAVIVGLDNNPDLPAVPGVEHHCGNQRNRIDVLAAAKVSGFDLIIDDASHIIHDQLACLFWLWPFLKPGGYYVIEEMDVQDGMGPHFNLPSYDLLHAKTFRTPSPNGDELLVVIQKPPEKGTISIQDGRKVKFKGAGWFFEEVE